jgi:pyrroline-5-carboxylate reductase
MAEAMVAALLEGGVARPHAIFASDVSADCRDRLKARFGMNTYAGNLRILEMAPTVFLCVKPQDLGAVLTEIAPAASRKHLIISIAAGKSIRSIESVLRGARIIRVMPNMACLVSRSMSVFALGSSATEADRKTASKLLSAFGETLELPEKLFNAVTALSGSGPAFFAYLLNKMVAAAVREGLEREDALLLAQQTMLGTADLLIRQGIDPDDLIKAVSSAKGTTAEGIKVMKASPITRILRDTIHAAAARSRELSRLT